MTRSAIIFDLDGTLTKPHLNFDAIRAEIGLPPGPILESLADLDALGRARAEAILTRHEWEAAEAAMLYEGAVEVVAECRALGHATAVLTRNTRPIVDYLLQRFGFVFDAVRTRENGAVKPSAEPVLSICRGLRCEPSLSWVVGDFLFDIMSGQAAGTRTVLMIGEGPLPEFAPRADHVIRTLGELLPLVGRSLSAADQV
jgi:HAD superfamily hydrolase (TIGR01549 family)